uniref:Uncharacterized protein n=1 Tax=Salix viminalis TaxID=40686 RepID=A0A6N2KEV8_SALVM
MCNTRERNGGGTQTLSVPAVGSGGGPKMLVIAQTNEQCHEHEQRGGSFLPLSFLWQVLQCRRPPET